MFATSYATRFPRHIRHLILASPAGVGHPPAEIFNTKQLPLPFRIFRRLWQMKITPMSVIRFAGPFGLNWIQKKSGKNAMHTHLLPGAFAKRPLCDMLTQDTVKFPVSFMYGGSRDWMDANQGQKVVDKLKKTNDIDMWIVPEAGHQLFLDNPQVFNHMVTKAILNRSNK